MSISNKILSGNHRELCKCLLQRINIVPQLVIKLEMPRNQVYNTCNSLIRLGVVVKEKKDYHSYYYLVYPKLVAKLIKCAEEIDVHRSLQRVKRNPVKKTRWLGYRN